jgi:hypothetical protein
MIVEKVRIDGSGKGTSGWFKLEEANVSFDHPFNAPFEHALNIDFVNESQGSAARVAVELSERARDLVRRSWRSWIERRLADICQKPAAS